MGAATASLMMLRNRKVSWLEVRKPMFFAFIGSLCVFLLVGKVMWSIGFVMMVGQVAGAWAGSKSLLTIHPMVLRILVVSMCLAMLCKYMLSEGLNPL